MQSESHAICPCFIEILRFGKRLLGNSANESGCTYTWEELDKPMKVTAQGQGLRRGSLQGFQSLGFQSLPRRRQSRAVQKSRFVGKSSWPVATWEDFKQMGFEVMAEARQCPLQIEVVVLDSAATYQSGKLVVKCCMKCLRGQFWRRYHIKDSTLPRSVPPGMEARLWLLDTVARVHRLRSVHLETQG